MLWRKIGKRKARAEKNQRDMRARWMLKLRFSSYNVKWLRVMRKWLMVIQSEMRG